MEKTPTFSLLREARREFIQIKSLVEESHLFKRILQCHKCGQIYLYISYEKIDWERGSDPHYTSFIPVEEVSDAEDLNRKSLFELGCIVPRLQYEFSEDNERKIEWVEKNNL